MGATVTTDRVVTAVCDQQGNVFYALYESVYEKNVHPHIEVWSCVDFGRAEDMLRRIFSLAHDVNSGMLQGRNGRLTAASYVASWLAKMAQPLEGSQAMFRVQVVDKEWPGSGEITQRQLDAIKPTLVAHGFSDCVEAMQSDNGFEGQLETYAPLLADLCTVARACRFLGRPLLDSPMRPEMGWAPRKAATPPHYEFPGVYRMPDGADNIVIETGGVLTIGPWEYVLAGDFISAYAELELKNPGYHKQAFKEMKKHFASLPELPKTALVEIDPDAANKHWVTTAKAVWESMGCQRLPYWQIDSEQRSRLGALSKAVKLTVLDSAQQDEALAAGLSPIGQMVMEL